MNSDMKCCVCLENFEPSDGVSLPCGHNQLCKSCFEQLQGNSCPVCRTSFRDVHPNPVFESDDHRQLIEEYRNDYENEYLMDYPEFSQKKLHLDENLLTQLPPKEHRTREQVIDWMTRNLSYEELCYAGW